MTEDELKELTMGDKVYVRAEVFYVNKNGSQCQVAVYDESGYRDSFYVKAGDVYRALPGKAEGAVKDVACRLFRKGDWVRIVKHQGRKFNAAPPAFQLGKTYRVSEDENTEHCYVMLQSCDLHYAHPVAFLELVSPRGELEPYSVKETMSLDGWQIVRDGLPLALYDSRRHPNAKAAAEAECKRLNEEWQTKVCRSEDGKEGVR